MFPTSSPASSIVSLSFNLSDDVRCSRTYRETLWVEETMRATTNILSSTTKTWNLILNLNYYHIFFFIRFFSSIFWHFNESFLRAFISVFPFFLFSLFHIPSSSSFSSILLQLHVLEMGWKFQAAGECKWISFYIIQGWMYAAHRS